MAEGNENVILCERGIRTFETSMRNTLDLAGVVMLHKMTHLPVVVDPSHACGHAWMVRRRPDDRGPQRPRQGQVRRRPEPDPRPVRRADGLHQAGGDLLWQDDELTSSPPWRDADAPGLFGAAERKNPRLYQQPRACHFLAIMIFYL